ncbi:Alpha/beta hydrolase fold protein [Mycena sanguinolenta]|uniref:Alpha/beta hydrolase fold protein n=1 Tax=Mycena sanguinolenta TaxID=230812 RepID=A0A8H6YIY9_9AGAR|nr:Alpha/beta hydrolase fold protein [Mycena sanguinolenta]
MTLRADKRLNRYLKIAIANSSSSGTMANVSVKRINVDNGISVFYRTASPPDLPNAPTLLLLHGYPSSSHQYRHLIPLLAKQYKVIAPDFPGFGFTEVPPERNYEYTFASLTTTLAAFLDALHISSFAVYIFDYGAPVLLRLALQRPDAITAIVSQNGNAYEEGLGPAWVPIKAFWASNESEPREVVRNTVLTAETTKYKYTHGSRFPDAIEPESYTLDALLMMRPGNIEIQLALFKDYENNVKMYPQFQEYFRKSQVPLLAVWGEARSVVHSSRSRCVQTGFARGGGCTFGRGPFCGRD